jgi:hypothetical protein
MKEGPQISPDRPITLTTAASGLTLPENAR